MLERIAIYWVLGLVLSTVDVHYDNGMFWCILALFIANEWLTRQQVWADIERRVKQLNNNKDNNNDNNNDTNN